MEHPTLMGYVGRDILTRIPETGEMRQGICAAQLMSYWAKFFIPRDNNEIIFSNLVYRHFPYIMKQKN